MSTISCVLSDEENAATATKTSLKSNLAACKSKEEEAKRVVERVNRETQDVIAGATKAQESRHAAYDLLAQARHDVEKAELELEDTCANDELKLYCLTSRGYSMFQAAIVIAKSENHAKTFNPFGRGRMLYSCSFGEMCDGKAESGECPCTMKATLIGTPCDTYKKCQLLVKANNTTEL